MNNKNVITITNEEGKELEYEVLFEYYDEERNKNYVGYTDNQTDEFDNIMVYASIFDPTGQDKTLYPIETEEEWDIIETVFSKLPELNGEN